MSIGIDEALHAIKSITEAHENNIQYLVEENKKLRDEHYKDTELADMKRQLDSLKEAYYRGFPLTEQEKAQIDQWQKIHDTNEHNNPTGYHGVSGGGFAYMFYPTAIGILTKCRCNICHKRALNYAVTNSMVKNEFDLAMYNEYMRDHNALIEFEDY